MLKELIVDLNWPEFCSSAELLKDYFGTDLVDLRKVTLEQFIEIENKYRVTYGYVIVNYAIENNWLSESKLDKYAIYDSHMASSYDYAEDSYLNVQKLIELIDEEN